MYNYIYPLCCLGGPRPCQHTHGSGPRLSLLTHDSRSLLQSSLHSVRCARKRSNVCCRPGSAPRSPCGMAPLLTSYATHTHPTSLPKPFQARSGFTTHNAQSALKAACYVTQNNPNNPALAASAHCLGEQMLLWIGRGTTHPTPGGATERVDRLAVIGYGKWQRGTRHTCWTRGPSHGEHQASDRPGPRPRRPLPHHDHWTLHVHLHHRAPGLAGAPSTTRGP
jgi:hypothetical protein